MVRANSRYTIWVDDEQLPAGSGVRPLADAAVSTTITSTNGVPVDRRAVDVVAGAAASRLWTEAHNSPGATATGTRWALAEGEVGGADDTETYILIANTSPTDGGVRVTLLFEDGTTAETTRRCGATAGSTSPSASNSRRPPSGVRRDRREPRRDAGADRRRARDVLERQRRRSGPRAPTRWPRG